MPWREGVTCYSFDQVGLRKGKDFIWNVVCILYKDVMERDRGKGTEGN